MKIVIKKDGVKINVYHHPKEVIYNGKSNIVELREIGNEEKSEIYTLKSKKLEWLRCSDSGNEEILVTLEVELIE